MSLLLAATGAVVTAVLEVTLADYVKVGNAFPHPALVFGVIWTIAAGFDRGLVWAFVGGLVLDALTSRPLGASAFALLVAVGAARVIAQPLGRLRLIAPVIAVPLVSLLYSVLILVLASSGQAAPFRDPGAVLVPGAVYDAILAVVLGPLIISTHDSRTAVERVDW
jgi:rod shape-determining protein MreD